MASWIRRRALIVDRDRSRREFFADILGDWNFVTHAASSEQEAIDLVAHTRFDLVIVDLKALTGDELALIGKLRKQTDGTPFLAMSTNGSARYLAHQIGASAFLDMPFDLNDLEVIVNRLVKSAGASCA